MKEKSREGHSRNAHHQVEAGIDKPHHTQRPDFAGIILQFKLQSGYRREYDRHRPAASGAECLSWLQPLTTRAAKHWGPPWKFTVLGSRFTLKNALRLGNYELRNYELFLNNSAFRL